MRSHFDFLITIAMMSVCKAPHPPASPHIPNSVNTTNSEDEILCDVMSTAVLDVLFSCSLIKIH